MQCVGFSVLTAHQFCGISLEMVIFGVGLPICSVYARLESKVASSILVASCYVVFTLEGVYAGQL